MELADEASKECLRIEEDSVFSAKSHFEAASFWRKTHLWIGVPSAVLAGVVSVSAFKEQALVAGALSILVAAFGAVATFLNPSGKASEHHSAGNSYLALRNRSRRFRSIELGSLDIEDIKERVLSLGQQKDELSASTPEIPEWAFKKARKNIEDGQTEYDVDRA